MSAATTKTSVKDALCDDEDEDIIETLIDKAEQRVNDLTEEALKDVWEIDQAIRRLKARLA
jgi:hypothetical protein